MWTYRTDSGAIVASVKRDDAPQVGWPVSVGGNGGPVRHYRVLSADAAQRTAILEVDLTDVG